MTLDLEIDNEILQQLEHRVERSEFESLEEYIEFILGQVAAPAPEIESVEVSANREEEVRDRLRSLGYIE